jgi:probable F420-dependent oxidoreductase
LRDNTSADIHRYPARDKEPHMKIGLQAFVTERTANPANIARKAESLGFDSMFVPEHPIIPVHHRTPYPMGDGTIPEIYAHMPDPFISLALAAGATSRLKVATGICLVPERDPIVMAKEISTLDHFSGGRFMFGIGAGWLADESEIMGVEFKRRWPMTREYIAAMKELWTKPEPSFEGKFVSFPKVKFFPSPHRSPIRRSSSGPAEWARTASARSRIRSRLATAGCLWDSRPRNCQLSSEICVRCAQKPAATSTKLKSPF